MVCGPNPPFKYPELYNWSQYCLLFKVFIVVEYLQKNYSVWGMLKLNLIVLF